MIANQLVLKVITNLYHGYSQIARLEQKHTAGERELKRIKDKQMRAQREETEAALCAAREKSAAAEKDKYLRQQRELQAQTEAARRKQQEQEETLNNKN